MNTINEITFSRTLLRVASQGAVETDGANLRAQRMAPILSFRMLNVFKNGLGGIKENTVI